MNYTGPVIDNELHHSWKAFANVVDYLEEPWRQLVREGTLQLQPASKHFPPAYGSFHRMDTFPDDESLPASNIELLRSQHLDPLNIVRAVLGYDVGHQVDVDNPYLGAAFASAANDWSLETWLSGADDRLYGAILVCSKLPELAATEIRRLGDQVRMVEVRIADGGVGPPLGHPIYHPIYEAAAEFGLPVSIHIGAPLFNSVAHLNGGGPPLNRVDYIALQNQPGMHHAVSFITHGVFEKWPTMRLVLLEDAINWIPWVFGQLDIQYKALKLESPWVKQLPSDYVRKFIRFSTQPFEPADKREQQVRFLESFEGIENVLCYGSDYPHFDADETAYVARYLPKSWHRKVFYENALNFYRWPAEVSLAPLSGSGVG